VSSSRKIKFGQLASALEAAHEAEKSFLEGEKLLKEKVPGYKSEKQEAPKRSKVITWILKTLPLRG
jgi:hypothetical protein